MGYHRAGFDVVGVDVEPQPHYPFTFIQADALTFDLSGFDAIHASPPCQAFSQLRFMPKRQGDVWPDLLTPTRERLIASGKHYVIENVVGAPLRRPIELCGALFGLRVRRHRRFECSFAAWSPACRFHHDPLPVGVYGDHPQRRNVVELGFRRNRAESIDQAADAMGIDWMSWRELTQAIPPAYTQFLGRQLMAALERERAKA